MNTRVSEGTSPKKKQQPPVLKIISETWNSSPGTSATFADMGDDENIYQFMADRVAELEPKCHIVVMSIDTDTKMTTMRAFAGDKEMTKVIFAIFP